MKNALNPYLFRHRESSSAALNNLCTLVHRLPSEGLYFGEVTQARRSVGTFRVRFARSEGESQATIDLSTFDAVFRANTPRLAHTSEFVVGGEGHLVFHVSGPHAGLRVRLFRKEEGGTANVFDSQQLRVGDIAVFRPLLPGVYALVGRGGHHRASLTVHSDFSKAPSQATALAPVTVELSDKGFDQATIEAWPTQAVLTRVTGPDAVDLLWIKNGVSPDSTPTI